MSALGCLDILGGPAAPKDLNLTPFPPPLYHSCTLHHLPNQPPDPKGAARGTPKIRPGMYERSPEGQKAREIWGKDL